MSDTIATEQPVGLSDGHLRSLIADAMQRYETDSQRPAVRNDEVYVEGEAGYIIEALRPYLSPPVRNCIDLATVEGIHRVMLGYVPTATKPEPNDVDWIKELRSRTGCS